MPGLLNPDYSADDYDQYLEQLYSAPEQANSAIDDDISAFVDSTSENPGPSARPPLPVSTPVSASVSSERQGYNPTPQNRAAVKRNFSNPLDAEIARAQTEAAAEGQQAVDNYGRVTEEKKVLAKERGNLDAQVADVNAQAAQDQAELHGEMVFTEKLEKYKADKKVEAALADQMSALQAYQASSINPGALWDGMDKGTKFTTGVAVFAAGLLAAKGIPTSTMDSLNQAIERNISAQVANMNKKGQAVGMFRDVYNQLRSQSESDAEAREKMRGMMLAEFKSGVTAKLAAFDSDYARLKAQEVSAVFDEEQAKHLERVQQQVRGNVERAKNFALDRHYKEAQLSIDRGKLALMQKTAALKDSAAETLNPGDYVVDPTPGGEGRAYKFLPGIQPVAKEKQRERLANEGKLFTDLAEYQRLAAELGNRYDGPLKNISIGRDKSLYELKRKMDSQREKILLNYVKGVAATTFTDAFVKRVEGYIGKNTLTTGTARSVNQSIGALMNDSLEDSRQQNKQYFSYETNPEIVKYVTQTRAGNVEEDTRNFGQEASGLAKSLYDSIPEGTTEVKKFAAKANAVAHSPEEHLASPSEIEPFKKEAREFYKTSAAGKDFINLGKVAEIAYGTGSPEEVQEAKATLQILAQKEYYLGIPIQKEVAKVADFWLNKVNEIESKREAAQTVSPNRFKTEEKPQSPGVEGYVPGTDPNLPNFVDDYYTGQEQ